VEGLGASRHEKQTFANPPTCSQKGGRRSAPEAAWQLSAGADIQLGGRELPLLSAGHTAISLVARQNPHWGGESYEPNLVEPTGEGPNIAARCMVLIIALFGQALCRDHSSRLPAPRRTAFISRPKLVVGLRCHTAWHSACWSADLSCQAARISD